MKLNRLAPNPISSKITPKDIYDVLCKIYNSTGKTIEPFAHDGIVEFRSNTGSDQLFFGNEEQLVLMYSMSLINKSDRAPDSDTLEGPGWHITNAGYYFIGRFEHDNGLPSIIK
jgi:hypothetical protein